MKQHHWKLKLLYTAQIQNMKLHILEWNFVVVNRGHTFAEIIYDVFFRQSSRDEKCEQKTKVLAFRFF